MMSFFLSFILTLGISESTAPIYVSFPEVSHQETYVTTASYFQIIDEPKSMEEGDKDAYEPYPGFTIIGGIMIAATISVVAFVVIRVFKRMSKSRRYEAEKEQGGDENIKKKPRG